MNKVSRKSAMMSVPSWAVLMALLTLMLGCAKNLAFSTGAVEPSSMAHNARIISFAGIPTLEVDARLQSGMARSGGRVSDYAEFRKIGVHIFAPILTASEGFWEPPVWTGPETWDYRRVDSTLGAIFTQIPDAYVLVRLDLSAPRWWREKYPSEIVKTLQNDGRLEPLLLPKLDSHLFTSMQLERKTVPSYASQIWLRDTSNGIERLIRYLEDKPYGKRIIGYFIGSGSSYEWFAWGETDIDQSDCNIAGFRSWLAKQYPSVAALQAAWRMASITFENAPPPSERRVSEARFGSLRDPQAEQQIIDFLQYNSGVVAHAVETLAAAVKQAASRPVIVGTYFGYLHNSDPRWGHQDLVRILQSPHVDFLTSPTLYWEHRNLGVAAPGPMVPLGSVRLHGKYWLSETDIRTSLTGPAADWFQAKPKGLKEDFLFQRRELAWILAAGVGQWWVDVSDIRYDHPDLMALLSRLTAIADAAVGIPRTPQDVAIAVIDPASAYYLKPGDPLLNELRRLQIDQLTRSGMATATYSSDDLTSLKDKRLIVFCDMIAPSPETQAAIESLKSAGRVLVFLWGAGSVSEGRFNPAAAEKVTGIKLGVLEDGANLRVTLADDVERDRELNGLSYGVERLVTPTLVPQDEQAEVWGRLDSGEPGLVVKQYPGWTAVYSSAPLLPAALLSSLGKRAGIHQYASPGDALWVSQGMLALNAFSPGTKRLHFSTPVRLYDYFAHRELGSGQDFELRFSTNETRLFQVEELENLSVIGSTRKDLHID